MGAVVELGKTIVDEHSSLNIHPQKIVVLSLDALGDFVLRQPMLSAFLDQGASVTVVVQERTAELVRYADERLTLLTTDVNPYGVPADTASVDTLCERIELQEPDELLCAVYNRSLMGEWILSHFPNLKRSGFHNPRYPPSLLDCARRDHPHLPSLPHGGLFTRSVCCSPETHEIEKNALMCRAVCDVDIDGRMPAMTVTDEALAASMEVLDGVGFTGGEYVVGCPAGQTSKVVLKAWPVESYVFALMHLWNTHRVPTLLIGHHSEMEYLQKIAALAKNEQMPVRIWTGSGGDLGALLGLISRSRLFVGADTGPMHLAGALGIPVLAIFGGGTWPRFTPLADPSFVATQELPCFGCNWNCLLGDPLCIELVETREICHGIDWIMDSNSKGRVISAGATINPVSRDIVRAAKAINDAIQHFVRKSKVKGSARLGVVLRREMQSQGMNVKFTLLGSMQATLRGVQTEVALLAASLFRLPFLNDMSDLMSRNMRLSRIVFLQKTRRY
jgi:ADP-heptose:LPS heptosyltransferase